MQGPRKGLLQSHVLTLILSINRVLYMSTIRKELQYGDLLLQSADRAYP